MDETDLNGDRPRIWYSVYAMQSIIILYIGAFGAILEDKRSQPVLKLI